MNCATCGAPLHPGDAFCTTCGTSVTPAPVLPVAPAAPPPAPPPVIPPEPERAKLPRADPGAGSLLKVFARIGLVASPVLGLLGMMSGKSVALGVGVGIFFYSLLAYVVGQMAIDVARIRQIAEWAEEQP